MIFIEIADLQIETAIKILGRINPDVRMKTFWDEESKIHCIKINSNPKKIVYPYGWNLQKGYFTNLDGCVVGIPERAIFLNKNLEKWNCTNLNPKSTKITEINLAIDVMKELNWEQKIQKAFFQSNFGIYIMTNTNPMDLIYLKGWTYEKGFLVSKFGESSDMARFITPEYIFWENIV